MLLIIFGEMSCNDKQGWILCLVQNVKVCLFAWKYKSCITGTETHDVFTLSWSGTRTGTGTRTSIMHNLSHCTWTGKNGLYGFNKNLSHCTWRGTGKNTSIHHQEHFQNLRNGYQTHSSGPENVPGVLPCPCSGAVWKVLIKTIQPFLPGPSSCPGPSSGPSQCEYTISLRGSYICTYWTLHLHDKK